MVAPKGAAASGSATATAMMINLRQKRLFVMSETFHAGICPDRCKGRRMPGRSAKGARRSRPLPGIGRHDLVIRFLALQVSLSMQQSSARSLHGPPLSDELDSKSLHLEHEKAISPYGYTCLTFKDHIGAPAFTGRRRQA
jgi:hypothetical protein